MPPLDRIFWGETWRSPRGGTRPARGLQTFGAGTVRVIILILQLLAGVQLLLADSRQIVTEERLKAPGWWPTKGGYARSEYVGPEACAECHIAQAKTWKTTPMARAGFAAHDSEILQRHSRLEFRRGTVSFRIEDSEETPTYTVTEGAEVFFQPLQWAMGLGVVGQTFVYERAGSYYESRVTYYSSVNRLDLTPGQSGDPCSTSLTPPPGRLLPRVEAERCFACHTTAAFVENRLQPSGLIAGVTCEACHGPGVRHIAAMKAGESVKGTIFNPSGLKASESVDFCGACHRTWWDVVLMDINSPLNVRFQPYRLQGSRCWNPDDARIACISCHDPHQPVERRVGFYDNKCLACHAARAGEAVSPQRPGRACPVETRECTTCHKPKIEFKGMYHKFSDHRLRVARPGAPYPN